MNIRYGSLYTALLVPVAFIAFAMAAPSSNDAAARGHSLFAADIYKVCVCVNEIAHILEFMSVYLSLDVRNK